MKKIKDEVHKEENIIYKFARDNYAWITALITFIGVIFSAIFKFIDYFRYNIYCKYYGIDMKYYQLNDKALILEVGEALLIFGSFYAAIYCIIHIKEGRGTNKRKIAISNLTTIFAINILITYYFLIRANSDLSFIPIIITFFIVFIIQIIISIFLILDLKKEKLKEKEISQEELIVELKMFLKVTPIVILLYMIMLAGLQHFSIINTKDYRIASDQNEQKVIVYVDTSYYIVLDCEITSDNKLIIYKGTQQKIKSDNVKTNIVVADKVELK